jgi:UPF0755 protein
MKRASFARRLTLVAVSGTVLAGIAILVGLWWLRHEWTKPWPSGGPAQSIVVDIEAGSSGSEILRQLEDAGVLASARWTRLLLIHRLQDPPLQAGEYRFELPASSEEILAQLIAGQVVTRAVTVIEGLTLQETAAQLASQGFGDLDSFLSEMSDPGRVLDLDPEAQSLEGYLYPDTYSFSKGTPESAIVEALVNNFRRRLPALPQPRPERSLRDLVILASIVEKEAQRDEERALIAGVYANRLAIGMALYADPTIIYGLKLDGRWDGNLRRADLRWESPYNTYLVGGLPPTPICSPRFDSLVAAAQPSTEPFLYFVSRNDGTHVFSRTLSEHNRNVNLWQKQYWRKRWREEAARKTPPEE